MQSNVGCKKKIGVKLLKSILAVNFFDLAIGRHQTHVK